MINRFKNFIIITTLFFVTVHLGVPFYYRINPPEPIKVVSLQAPVVLKQCENLNLFFTRNSEANIKTKYTIEIINLDTNYMQSFSGETLINKGIHTIPVSYEVGCQTGNYLLKGYGTFDYLYSKNLKYEFEHKFIII